jgi:hypothetical protein
MVTIKRQGKGRQFEALQSKNPVSAEELSNIQLDYEENHKGFDKEILRALGAVSGMSP